MNTIDNPFLVPLGTYPPATVRWSYFSTTVPTGVGVWVVPWQPGTPPGVVIPISWYVTDIFVRLENAASVGNTTVVVNRYTGTGPFVSSSVINTVPVTIVAGANEPTTRPPLIANPIVNSGDKLELSISLGTGASLISVYVVLTQKVGS
jgi:hypothetical protein